MTAAASDADQPRRIVVTGAASGIGAAFARAMAAAGHEVITVDRAGAEINADLSVPAGRDEALTAIRERAGGRIDTLVPCAGVSSMDDLTIRVNFFAVTHLVEGLHAELAASGTGRIALVGSISSTQPNDPAVVEAMLAGDEPRALELARTTVTDGRPQQLYASSKYALTVWARRLAITPAWAGANIAINVVAPGVVLTPMSAGLRQDPQMVAVMAKAVPMPFGGYCEPETVAEALAFLASPANTAITGQVLFVDGGAEASTRGAEGF